MVKLKGDFCGKRMEVESALRYYDYQTLMH